MDSKRTINYKPKQQQINYVNTRFSTAGQAQWPELNGQWNCRSGIGDKKGDNSREPSDFQNVEHRLEFVARVHGIEFINDSKATNVNSTWYALESMSKPWYGSLVE